MRTSRQSRLWLGVAAVALVVAALTSPHLIPLYDGVGFPDEPYRYAGRGTQLPAGAIDQIITAASASAPGYLASQESGPQIVINIGERAISLPAGAPQVHIQAIPTAPPAQPAGGTIAGNVYVVTATSTPGPPAFTTNNILIDLRLPQDVPATHAPVLVYRAGSGAWRQVAATQVGSDVYESVFQGVGEYALAIMAAGPTAPAPRSHDSAVLAGVSVTAGIIIIAVVLLRLAGRRRMPDDPR